MTEVYRGRNLSQNYMARSSRLSKTVVTKEAEVTESEAPTTVEPEPLLTETQETGQEDMAKRSRLSKTSVRRSQKTLVLSILGILAVLFLLIKYGIPLISDASFIFGRATSSDKNSSSSSANKDANYVPPPTLDPLSTATKSQKITITGSSVSGLKIQLYLNGSLEDDTSVGSDGSFSFNVDLTEGENIVKARAVKDKNDSDFSDSQTITYKKGSPNLSIDNPHDGDNLSGGNQVTVNGKADPDDTVTVNDFQAVIDSSGNWTYTLTLPGGGTDIKVVATDEAGNQTAKSIHVNYSQ